MPGVALKTIAQFIDIAFLREAHRRTRKDGAVGVDRQTAEDYATELESNLQRLLDRAKSGTYRAPPVRRVYIPKGDGSERRPIGIPTFEDKILQRAVKMARWCRHHRHTPLVWQHAALCRKLHGHYGYYGITGNAVAITRFRWEVRGRWQKWLNRRGAPGAMPWPRFEQLERRYPLPAAIAIHSIFRPTAKP